MSSRAFIAAGVCLALALGGCSLTPTSSSSAGGFAGAAANVATELNLLASDASSANGSDICKNVLAASVRSKLNQLGTCATIIDNQLKTSDDFTMTVEAIKVTGSTATAQVKTVRNGKKIISTVSLVKQSGGWRITSI
ncbi:MAG TPA: nuclear transport factor 2 family protein [Solirubrobacteraceae bacterium]|nr:nuclear transport factor 2 family protein [Solirubrobacteraceae bacterium]